MKTFIRPQFFLIFLACACTKELVPLPETTLSLQNDGCTAPCQVTFNIQAQYTSSVVWDFGDGSISKELNPTHTFKQAKPYQVSLTLQGEGGSVGVTKTVTINSATKQWDKTLGGSNQDSLRALVATSDGGFLLGGDSYSGRSGDKSEDARGSGDYWVVKVNANGEKQWDKTFGGPKEDCLRSLVATPDGGFLIGGYSESNQSNDKREDSRGERDYWLIKLNANGDKLWDKTLGGDKDDKLTSMVATSDGGFLVGGSSNSTRTGDKSEDGRLDYDYWVVKINSNGEKQWDKTLGGSSYDGLLAIALTADGGFILGGDSSSNISGDKSESPRGNNDFWLVKLNMNGEKQWDKILGGSDQDYLRSLVGTPEGGFLVGGYSSSISSGDKSDGLLGGYDYWLIKINANGEKQWDKTLGGSNNDYLSALLVTSNGDFLVGGYSYSNKSADKSEDSRGAADFWTIKLDAYSGSQDKPGKPDKQWDKLVGGNDDDKLWLGCVAKTADGSFIVGGSSSSGQTSDKSEPSRGFSDWWLVKIR